MKKNVFVVCCVFLIFGLFLFGFSKSQQTSLTTTAVYYPFWLGYDFPGWDWESDKIADLDEVRIRDWEGILKDIPTSGIDPEEFVMEMSSFEKLVQDNIFSFSRLGTCNAWHPTWWDVVVNLKDNEWDGFPSSNILRSILLDESQKKTREAFTTRCMEIFKDPNTKKLWEAQRTKFWEDNEIYSVDDIYDLYTEDYNKMLNTGYDAAMLAALDNVIKYMESTNYSLKVLPASGLWQLIQVTGEVFQVVWDETPFKVQSICYRMGKTATSNLLVHVKELRRQIAIK